MSADILAELAAWFVPALVVFGVTAIAIAVIVWAVRAARRGPRARAATAAAQDRAGVALVALDDAVGELDLEVGLSGALYGGEAAAVLRRARMSAQHSRDDAFDRFRQVLDETQPPPVRRQVAERITTDAERALAAVQKARAAHSQWVARHVDTRAQLAASRDRLDALEAAQPGGTVFLAELSERFDESEWADAAHSRRRADTALVRAREAIDAAAADAGDPTRSLLPRLADAEHALRAAEDDQRRIEDEYRRVTQASAGAPGEIAAARAELQSAVGMRDALTPAAGDRLAASVRDATQRVDELAAIAARRPTAAIDGIARVRDRLDLALGDARSSQQRLRGARAALPGTLAAARNAIAHATASVQQPGAGAEARVRLAAANDALADARRVDDPVAALDAARRALRHADDAKALADHARHELPAS